MLITPTSSRTQRLDRPLMMLLFFSFFLSIGSIAILFMQALEGVTNVATNSLDGKDAAFMNWDPERPGLAMLLARFPLLMGITLLQLFVAVFLTMRGFAIIRKLNRDATIDSLSGLSNRKALRAEMARRMRRHEDIALAFIDLDAFKAVNDGFGHEVGDTVIREVSARIAMACDQTMTVARLGGDEFALATFGPGCAAHADRIALRLVEDLSLPIEVEGRMICVGASIGLARAGALRLTPTELMRRADMAMYAAKRAGKRRRLWFAPSMDIQTEEANRIAVDLRTAVAEAAFSVHYQPLFDARTEDLVGVEALVRWERNPGCPDVPPSVFIPVAEETGLIETLGLQVLETACKDALQWPGLQLAVNVSTAQLCNPSFPNHVRSVLAQTGFNPADLELEITEGLLVRDPGRAVQIMTELREMGVRFSLDDFGTGFASIGYLRRFAFDKLKLDRSLVTEAENSEVARAVVNASISLADVLGLEVVAEGVETRLQADLMRIAGCKVLQGWLFSQPLPACEIARLCQQGASVVPRMLLK